MRKDIEEFCESIDAAIFSGDGLHDYESLNEFHEYMDRWMEKMREISNFLDEEDKIKGNK